MSALRDEIRAILREEIAALRIEGAASGAHVERVRIDSSADLTKFARDLIRRGADPAFSEKVLHGDLLFELSQTRHDAGPIVTSPPRADPARLDKALITERDIAGLDGSARSLRLSAQSRLTPLARDEARRRGIRIERTER